MNPSVTNRARVLLAVALCVAISTAAFAEKKRILVVASVAPDLADLTKTFPDLELIPAKPDEMAAKIVDVDAIVGIGPGPKLAEILKAGKNLEWIQASSAGAEEFVAIPEVVVEQRRAHQLEDAARARRRRSRHGAPAQHHPRHEVVERADEGRLRAEAAAAADRAPGQDRPGRRLRRHRSRGVQRAAGFGMRVLAIDVADVPPTREVEYIGQPEDLDRLLPEVDVLFITAPYTPATKNMIGPKQFELMKKGSYIVNVARGGMVDTAALTAALQSGKLAGAGLDVVEPEPLPADHPLWAMQNVTISPHAAGQMDGLKARQVELYRDNIERYLDRQADAQPGRQEEGLLTAVDACSAGALGSDNYERTHRDLLARRLPAEAQRARAARTSSRRPCSSSARSRSWAAQPTASRASSPSRTRRSRSSGRSTTR